VGIPKMPNTLRVLGKTENRIQAILDLIVIAW
jgi:hypothetical protein